jgi:uncharacterized HAD superfamily protein
MNYRTFEQMLKATLALSSQIQPLVLKGVVSIPRSGNIPSTIISLYLNIPWHEIKSFGNTHGNEFSIRHPGPVAREPGTYLIVDDSCDSGARITQAKKYLHERGFSPDNGFIFKTLCVYARCSNVHLLDFHAELVEQPRVFEWNIYHHNFWSNRIGSDIDGVVCEDPPGFIDEIANENSYVDYLRTAPVKKIFSLPIAAFVTSRLEKYRKVTEDWLAEHGLRYAALHMSPHETALLRRSKGSHAADKAKLYETSGWALFIESSEVQAREIFRLTGRPVLCTDNNTMYSTTGLSGAQQFTANQQKVIAMIPETRREPTESSSTEKRGERIGGSLGNFTDSGLISKTPGHPGDQQTVRGLVFVTGRNFAPYVKACIGSLARQTYRSFDVLLVDDASTDDSAALAEQTLAELLPGRHRVIRNATQYGKARNAFELLPTQSQADFVAILDGDDQLIDDNVLGDMANAYGSGYDVVWTNYRTDRGRLGSNCSLDPFQSPRGQGWRTSHFFSFRRSLIESVPISYFQDDQGRWLMAACDFAIAYPVLDQTRRYLFIPRLSYQYTETNSQSHHNLDPQSIGLNSRHQAANSAIVLQKKPLACTRYPTEMSGVLYSALSVKFTQLDERQNQLLLRTDAISRLLPQTPYAELAMGELISKENIPLQWLRDAGELTIDPGFLHHLSQTMDRYRNPRVFEFGTGRGAKSLARLCANRGGQLTSIEHDPQWFEQTRLEIENQHLSSSARVMFCPLQDVDFYGIKGKFYDMKWLSQSDVFDIVIVDGPPAATCPLARLPALPWIAQNLSTEGFHVFLNDFERDEEQKIVQIWRAVAPEFKYQTLRFVKDVCQITP